MDSYGEWLGEYERKGDRLIVYLDGSANLEFDIKGIPSDRFVNLGDFPEDFVQKIYSRRFEHLPEIMKAGNKRAQVYLPSDGTICPVGRGSYINRFNFDSYYSNSASRWVRKNFP